MEDTTQLIKNVATDIIMTTAIWGINQSVWGICQPYAITKRDINPYYLSFIIIIIIIIPFFLAREFRYIILQNIDVRKKNELFYNPSTSLNAVSI